MTSGISIRNISLKNIPVKSIITKNITIENIARMILIFLVFYYSRFMALPLKNIAGNLNSMAAGNVRKHIGGMAYTESELAEIAGPAGVNECEIIIPEPAAFSEPRTLICSNYKIQPGDMVGYIAKNFGLSQGTLISANSIKNTRQIYPGENLKIPNQDGIMHTASAGETLESIAEHYSASAVVLAAVNELFSPVIRQGDKIFIPGAELDSTLLQEINGDLFSMPVYGRVTSTYGYRLSPISNIRSFHTGIDIGQVTGAPVKAAMAGRVISTDYNEVFGNYVVIAHHSGYRTLYGHLSAIRTKSGAYVRTGETIGYVGNTGQSTGSHLHWTVYKNGRTVNPLTLVRH